MDPMGHEIDSERFKKLRLNVSYALSNLISSLGRVIDYYQSRNSDTPIERIFLIGLGADFSGLSKLLTNELNVKVVPLQQFDGIHVAKSINLAEAKLAEYFNCVGCSLSRLIYLTVRKTRESVLRLWQEQLQVLCHPEAHRQVCRENHLLVLMESLFPYRQGGSRKACFFCSAASHFWLVCGSCSWYHGIQHFFKSCFNFRQYDA